MKHEKCDCISCQWSPYLKAITEKCTDKERAVINDLFAAWECLGLDGDRLREELRERNAELMTANHRKSECELDNERLQAKNDDLVYRNHELESRGEQLRNTLWSITQTDTEAGKMMHDIANRALEGK